jgi:tetratricopeptide (TPR) repeat protein
MFIKIIYNKDKNRLGWHRLKSSFCRDRRCRSWNSLMHDWGPHLLHGWGTHPSRSDQMSAEYLSADLSYTKSGWVKRPQVQNQTTFLRVWRLGAAEALAFGESIISVWGEEPDRLFERRRWHSSSPPAPTRSLEIREKALGPEHPNLATSLNNLAVLYRAQGKYAEAEPLYKRSLAIMEKALGPDHPNVALILNNLAVLYRAQGKDVQAGPLYKRSLAIRKKALGSEHPDVGQSLNSSH